MIPFYTVSCGLPSIPANANIIATDLLTGSEATLRCNNGFIMSSGETSYNITCQEDGTWTSATFTCDGKWKACCRLGFCFNQVEMLYISQEKKDIILILNSLYFLGGSVTLLKNFIILIDMTF